MSGQRYSQCLLSILQGDFLMRYPTLILSAICLVLTAGAASAEKRVAFVVGNGAYKLSLIHISEPTRPY